MLVRRLGAAVAGAGIAGIRGIAGRTDMGELSVLPKKITLLAPCLWNIPSEWYEVKDPDVKYRKVCDFL